MRPGISTDEEVDNNAILNDSEDGWQEMPVVRSDDVTALDEEDRKKLHYIPKSEHVQASASATSNAIGHRIKFNHESEQQPADKQQPPEASKSSSKIPENEVVNPHLNILSGSSWREKSETLEETDYTRLELDEDHETDDVHLRTKYLFAEERDMTPLSQMHTTKNLLTEGQKIAYVGICKLITREMVHNVRQRNIKGIDYAIRAIETWAQLVISRLYKHMEISTEEQVMIELLGEHGVTAADLVPSLRTTHTVPNPEYEPDESKRAHVKEQPQEQTTSPTTIKFPVEEDIRRHRNSAYDDATDITRVFPSEQSQHLTTVQELKSTAPVSIQSDLEINNDISITKECHESKRNEDEMDGDISAAGLHEPEQNDDGDGDISTATKHRKSEQNEDEMDSDISAAANRELEQNDHGDGDISDFMLKQKTEQQADTKADGHDDSEKATSQKLLTVKMDTAPVLDDMDSDLSMANPFSEHEPNTNLINPLPNALPGVSTTLTDADETVTLDIRWTIICDLFLTLIADGSYDARSRVFLGIVADRLGLTWMDVIRFERRITEALEIEEGVSKGDTSDAMESRRASNKRKRLMMMGLASLGGGLVIGLSAGILAPLIGAGLGAAFTTVGITGTASFLGGAGGAAIITTGGVVTGTTLGGKGMARRTRDVSHFEFRPLHNNRRMSAYITMPGFMEGKSDDVRLPFSVLDPVLGDVFSVLWEPEMMGETGNALRILTSEVLTQVGQQVLAATVMATLMGALQWPMILTKLSYLIDNPWSNALDRARAAGCVLADILKSRQLGERPISLIGFSLGARAIFYCMLELAKSKSYGIVQDVYLFGTTVSAPIKAWQQIRVTAAGKIVNAYAKNDWLLAYLFRVSHGGMDSVAGLRAIEGVDGIDNVDVSDIVAGHMSYRALMPLLLERLGFKVTADHFDEPEDLDALYEQESEARGTSKKKKSFWKFGSKNKAEKDSSKFTEYEGPAQENKENNSVKDTKEQVYDSDGRDKEQNASETSSQPPSSSKAGFNFDEMRKEIENSSTSITDKDSSTSLTIDTQPIQRIPEERFTDTAPTSVPGNELFGRLDEVRSRSRENSSIVTLSTRPNNISRDVSISSVPSLTFADASGNVEDFTPTMTSAGSSDFDPSTDIFSPVFKRSGKSDSVSSANTPSSGFLPWRRRSESRSSSTSGTSIASSSAPNPVQSPQHKLSPTSTSNMDGLEILERPAFPRMPSRSKLSDIQSDPILGLSNPWADNDSTVDVTAPTRARSGTGKWST